VTGEIRAQFERYTFLKLGQKAVNNFRVVPPGTGICIRWNLEYLRAKTADAIRTQNGDTVPYPDTLVGTDSHTTMVNGLAVLGWVSAGSRQRPAMLDKPVVNADPEVVGFKITGPYRSVTPQILVVKGRPDAARPCVRWQIRSNSTAKVWTNIRWQDRSTIAKTLARNMARPAAFSRLMGEKHCAILRQTGS